MEQKILSLFEDFLVTRNPKADEKTIHIGRRMYSGRELYQEIVDKTPTGQWYVQQTYTALHVRYQTELGIPLDRCEVVHV